MAFNYRIPNEYEASGAEWHGGRIIITCDEEGYGISQIFNAGQGPSGRGGEYTLGYQHTRERAFKEASVHCRARKLTSFFMQEPLTLAD